MKLTCFSTGTPGLYSKLTSSNATSPSIAPSGAARASSSSSVAIVHQLADAIEAGERFADLRADRRDLHDRRGHQAGEEDVVDEVAERHAAVEDRAAADDDHDDADDADDRRSRTP